MRKLCCSALGLLLCLPSPALAWGHLGHEYITSKAIELLPVEIKPFFVRHRDELVMRANDPDEWRLIFDEEAPNHQINLGVDDYGPYPFNALPREHGAALEKFGAVTLRRYGLLPWRTTEEFGNLRRTIQGLGRNQLYADDNTVWFAAALAHYIQDATQPFHAHYHYDGQLTGQSGIHSRFESELIERFQSRLMLTPPPIEPVVDANTFIWGIVLDSHQLVPKILEADKTGIAGRDAYDDAYFEKFFANVRPVLERQLSRAVSATASAIVGAWQQAGRPVLRPERMPRAIQRVRQPK